MLWVTEQTVKFHLSNIYRKLGVSNRAEASRMARQLDD
jgi:DNA-binding CsgD family transcriptional regulator